MNSNERHQQFCDLLSRHQSQLYSYIFAMVRNRDDASDLFQSVCLVLWRKFDSFEPDSSFFGWARITAQRVVIDFVRRKKFHLHVSEELLDAFSETPIAPQSDVADVYLDALRRCRAKLSPQDHELLSLRYMEDLRNQQIAERLQRSQQSISNSLTRIRRALLQCIMAELKRQEHSTEHRA